MDDGAIDAGEDGGGVDVFISYDHMLEDREADDMALRLAEGLRRRGYTVWWDREMVAAKWRDQILAAAHAARAVVTLETKRYFTRDWCLREFRIGLEAGTLARFQLERCATPAALAEADAEQATPAFGLGADLADLVAKKLRIRPSQEPQASPARSARVDFDSLPQTERLIGRRQEREALRDAWSHGRKNVVALHAVGGAGKSALLHDFAVWLADEGDAARIYGWSAYSQGTNAASGRDIEAFLGDALRFFGGDPTGLSAIEQAEALADILAAERSALLLDGLEPLQSPPHVNKGRLTSRPLATLITRLAGANRGLLALTSRQPFPELATRSERVRDIPLERLTLRDGARLLRFLGARGAPRDYEGAVEAVDGHALSVALMGSYVAAVAGGHLPAREDLGFEALKLEDVVDKDDPTARYARRAERMAQDYLERLGDLDESAGKGAPERALLHMLGLFDRPAEGEAVRLLLAGPPIEGLTDTLFQVFALEADGLSERALSTQQRAQRWSYAKRRLRRLGLLAKENDADRDALDAHPIIRNYFRKRLKDTAPEGFRAAHERLYRHYAAAAPDQPDTLEAMQPLLQALAHGVAAGFVQEAFDEVYFRRIGREGAAYLNTQLGAYDASLAALAAFFTAPWTTPHPELRASDQEAALNYAAFALRAVGRLGDAVAPFRERVSRARRREAWTKAALDAGNLSQTELSLGRIPEAMTTAEAAVADAERGGDRFQRMVAQTTLADALHQAGRLEDAAAAFAAAEALQAEEQPSLPQLYSLRGYQYADLLLTRGEAAAAQARAAWIETVYDQHNVSDLLDRGLNALLAVRAAAAQLRAAAAPRRGFWARFVWNPSADADAAALADLDRAFDRAVERLIGAASTDHIPRGHIARAAFRRWRAEMGHDAGPGRSFAALAARDLDDAADIAGYSGMRLFQADIALERALLALRLDRDRLIARSFRDEAAALIQACGYGRRAPTLAALDAELG